LLKNAKKRPVLHRGSSKGRNSIFRSEEEEEKRLLDEKTLASGKILFLVGAIYSELKGAASCTPIL